MSLAALVVAGFPLPLFGKEGLGEIFFFHALHRRREMPLCFEKFSPHPIKSPLIPFSQRGNRSSLAIYIVSDLPANTLW